MGLELDMYVFAKCRSVLESKPKCNRVTSPVGREYPIYGQSLTAFIQYSISEICSSSDQKQVHTASLVSVQQHNISLLVGQHCQQ